MGVRSFKMTGAIKATTFTYFVCFQVLRVFIFETKIIFRFLIRRVLKSNIDVDEMNSLEEEWVQIVFPQTGY